MLRNNKLLKSLSFVFIVVLILQGLFLFYNNGIWTTQDYQVLDWFYRSAVSTGKGVKADTSKIVYLTVNDKTYHDYLHSNVLDRVFLAEIFHKLSQFQPRSVGVDLIFAYPTDQAADRAFAESISQFGSIFLPSAFSLSEEYTSFNRQGDWQDMQLSKYLYNTNELNAGKPYYAERAIMQLGVLDSASEKSGHICVRSDADGSIRKGIMLVKLEDSFYPSLSLAMFLDYVEVPFDSLQISWGKEIRIPALPDSWLNEDVIIPIDEHGSTYIPFPAAWGQDFPVFTVNSIIDLQKDAKLEGNFSENFEGRFVFFADVSTGISDLGRTPLEASAPLVNTHAALLNALLQNQFYKPVSSAAALIFLLVAQGMIFGFSLFKRKTLFYISTAVAMFSVWVWTWLMVTHFHLFPILMVSVLLVLMFTILFFSVQYLESNEQRFLREAFSRYVSPKVVNELLAKPDLLKLGGEEKNLTVLFSDIESFTSISEKLPPSQLVSLLNEYLTEMTDIILHQSGIIDKYQGDSIMAIFGAPLPLQRHAYHAVEAALLMDTKLKELNEMFSGKGYPKLRCRIGINTGPMVVGNIGSRQFFDYTVVGDSVNLASRLESANKFYGTRIMLSEYTVKALPDNMYRLRFLDKIKVKGKDIPICVYELLGRTDDGVELDPYYSLYQEALQAFLQKDFSAADVAIQKCLRYSSDDKAAIKLRDRIVEMRSCQLPDDWDGSLHMDSK